MTIPETFFLYIYQPIYHLIHKDKNKQNLGNYFFFYRNNYYNNIYEVGAELQAEIEKELFAERREFNSTDDIEQYVDQIFAFLKQQESVYRQLLASDAPMAFMDQLESGMTQRVLSIMHEKGIDDRNVEFELLILASGTFAIVRKYYRNEVSVTLDDIRAYLSNKLRVLFEQYVK